MNLHNIKVGTKVCIYYGYRGYNGWDFDEATGEVYWHPNDYITVIRTGLRSFRDIINKHVESVSTIE